MVPVPEIALGNFKRDPRARINPTFLLPITISKRHGMSVWRMTGVRSNLRLRNGLDSGS